MNYKILTIPHDQLTSNQLDQIVEIKQSAWNYSVESHKEWIRENINTNDLHFILSVDGEYIAYLNLVDIMVKVDRRELKAYGIGNVCSIKKGFGYGKQIIQEANQLLLNENCLGLLFCKEHLIPFYTKLGWCINNNVKVAKIENKQIQTLTYNLQNKKNALIYEGWLF